jgi:DNA-binding transcriptional ArsR family regulator
MAEESFVVLPLESKESKEIAKVMANETARQIMAKLAVNKCSSSQLSSELSLPLSTVEYNLDALQKVGMIRPIEYKWSRKGRKIHFFAPTKKLIIIAPEEKSASITEALKKNLQHIFMVLIAVTAIATGFYFPREALSARQAVAETLAEGVAAAGAPVAAQTGGVLEGAATGAFYASVIILVSLAVMYFLSRKLNTSR